MPGKKWKDNPQYKDDLLSRIAEAVEDVPVQLNVDYEESAVVGGVPLSKVDTPFQISDLSLSPSRLVQVDAEPFHEEKEKLKDGIGKALRRFRQARIDSLGRLYSPDESVQRALDEMELDGDLQEKLAEARSKLKNLGFSESQLESVCFMPKEKALEFASDELARFLRPVMTDFDAVFGRLSSFDPDTRKRAFVTVLRAWEEAAEEWEAEEKRSLGQLQPGMLERLSRADISFAQAMRNIANSSFNSMTDFDTALGAIVVSGMFPPAALLFALPMLVPELLDLLFSDLSEIKQESSRDQQALITSEMARLFASKATGNAMMAEIALKLSNGESPERVWNDMPKMKDKLRSMFDQLYNTGKQVFGEHAHNDVISPNSAEHLKMKDEIRDAAKGVMDTFWDERKERAVNTIDQSAKVEADIANSVRFNFSPEGVSFSFEHPQDDGAFEKLKMEQAEKNLKEYVDHLNKIVNGPDRQVNLFIESYGLLPKPIRIAIALASDYGISGNVAGSQSGTSMVETKAMLNALRNTDPGSPEFSVIKETIVPDAIVRLFPQELLGNIEKRMKDVDLGLVHYNDQLEKVLDISRPVEKSFSQVERALENMSEETRKTVGLLMYLSDIHYDDPDMYEMARGLLESENLRSGATSFAKDLKDMDDDRVNNICAELYTLFNRTVTEPGIMETVKAHEVPFEREDEEVEIER